MGVALRCGGDDESWAEDSRLTMLTDPGSKGLRHENEDSKLGSEAGIRSGSRAELLFAARHDSWGWVVAHGLAYWALWMRMLGLWM